MNLFGFVHSIIIYKLMNFRKQILFHTEIMEGTFRNEIGGLFLLNSFIDNVIVVCFETFICRKQAFM